MTFERSEYREHIAEASKAQASSIDSRHLHLVERAALEAKTITGDPHWDYYLSSLQFAIEQTEAHAVELRTKLSDSKVVDHNELLQIKLALAECSGRLDAWRVARDLPKELIDNGDKAHDLLSQLADTTP